LSKFKKILGSPERLKWVKEMNEIPYIPPKITKGKNTRIHPTVTLGDPGESLAVDENGEWVRCKHHGDVIIEDDVHIDAFSNVKRATLQGTATVVGKGTKICTYVNIAHNCKIGSRVFIGPHACLNGSIEVGDDAWISGHAVVEQGRKIGAGATVGMGAVVTHDVPPFETVVGVPAMPIKFVGNKVHPSFKYGRNLQIGYDNHIHEGVSVGDDVVIKSFTELRKGTIIGDRCYIDSGVSSSGQNKIGNDVTLRYDSIIARGVIIEDDVFISPQVMTENVNHKGETIGGAHIGTGEWDKKTKYRVFIGTNVTLAAGIEICSGSIIGTKANVRKSILEPGIYIGNPARRLER